MGKKPIWILGGVMACFGAIGTFNAVTSFGKAPVELADLAATGKVTSVNGTALQHRIGITIDTSYNFKYSFVAVDGKTYSGQDTINEAQFNSLTEGQSVSVRYNSNNPAINASSYGNYMSVGEFPTASPIVRFVVCLGTLVLGVGVIFSTRFVVDEGPKPQRASRAEGESPGGVSPEADPSDPAAEYWNELVNRQGIN